MNVEHLPLVPLAAWAIFFLAETEFFCDTGFLFGGIFAVRRGGEERKANKNKFYL